MHGTCPKISDAFINRINIDSILTLLNLKILFFILKILISKKIKATFTINQKP